MSVLNLTVQDGTIDLSDLAPVRLRLNYSGRTFFLLEASEEAIVSWKNKEAKRGKFGPTGEMISMENPGDTEVNLLAHVLYYASPAGEFPVDKDGLPDPKFLVPAAKIKLTFQTKVVRALVAKVREISGLDAEEETEKALVKRIADLTKKLDKVREEEELRKKSLAATSGTSGSESGSDGRSESSSVTSES